MRVTISNKIIIEDPSFELLAWADKNLVVRNPEYDKKVRLGFWVGKTPKELTLYEHRRDVLYLPFGVLHEISKLTSKDDHVEFDPFMFGQSVNFDCNVPLYDYQQQAVSALLQSGGGILEAPAGSGKTQMGIALAGRIQKPTLWLTHTKDLLNQSLNRAKQYIDESMLGTITEGKIHIGEAITFATVQTMCNLDLDWLKYQWSVIIVDECHRCAGTPTAVTRFSKVLNNLAAPYKYGLSATLYRSDGLIKTTFALLGPIRHTVSKEAVEDRIMRIGIRPVYTKQPVGDVFNTDGTLCYSKLINDLCTNAARNNTIISTIIDEESDFIHFGKEGHSSLILSDRLDHLTELIRLLLPELKEKAVMISGKMTSKSGKAEREQAIKDMTEGRKKYLFATYSLAKEGLDIPCLDRLYLTTPQKNKAVVTQSIGRIARTAEGKENPVVIDFIDDFPYLINAYKARWTSYRKVGCYLVR